MKENISSKPYICQFNRKEKYFLSEEVEIVLSSQNVLDIFNSISKIALKNYNSSYPNKITLLFNEREANEIGINSFFLYEEEFIYYLQKFLNIETPQKTKDVYGPLYERVYRVEPYLYIQKNHIIEGKIGSGYVIGEFLTIKWETNPREFIRE